jgi:NADPH:quinone reductase-like Zn-dependent oxidoreductase
VVVALGASTINRGELALLAARPDGWRPGQDIAGTVISPAVDGTGPSDGARVVGVVDGAAWSERVAVSTSRLAVLSDGVPFETAATLGLAGLTALRVLRLAGPLLGRHVLATGGRGGVGHLIVQLAAASGARVTADQLREGAFDVVLEGVGGRSLQAAVRALRPGGVVVLYGASDPEPAQLTLLDFIGREGARIVSFLSYAVHGHDADDLATLADLAADGRVRPTIAAAYPLERAGEALSLLARRGVRGKVVLTP